MIFYIAIFFPFQILKTAKKYISLFINVTFSLNWLFLFADLGMTPRGMTPRMGVAGQTPLRTPARDKLNINQEEDFDAPINDKFYQVHEALSIG